MSEELRELIEEVLALREAATAGPFVVEPNEGDQWVCRHPDKVRTGEGLVVAACMHRPFGQDEWAANARMFARYADAAPRLARALAEAMDRVEEMGRELEEARAYQRAAGEALDEVGGAMDLLGPLRDVARTALEAHGESSPGPWRACRASEGRCQCGLVWSEPRDVPVAGGMDEDGVGGRREDVRFIETAHRTLPELARFVLAAAEVLELYQRFYVPPETMIRQIGQAMESLRRESDPPATVGASVDDVVSYMRVVFGDPPKEEP